MGRVLFQCTCGTEVDALSDTVRCKTCSKIYHLSCPLNKGYISQPRGRPHIQILTCNECSSTTPIGEPNESSNRGNSDSSYVNFASNLNDLESSLHSNGLDASKPAYTNQLSVSSISSEPEAFANLCEPSDAVGTEKNCNFCKDPVSRESKILECIGCKKTYHYECAAYKPKELQELFEKNGWTCVNCFICEVDLKKEQDCRKCKKPVLEKTEKLQCHRCNDEFHHECGAHGTGQQKKLLEENKWLCGKCLTCDKKEQICSKCEKTAKKESKVLRCNKCEKLFHHECAVHAPKKLQEWFEKKGWICGNCLVKVNDSQEQDDKSKWKRIGKKAAIGAGLTAVCLGGIPLAVGALGFGAAGVAAGSLAAAYQSAFLGGTIVSGSAFAVLQSVGAAGLAASTQAGIAAVCTALPFLSELKKKKK